jgi:hypothetical protein
MNYVDAVAIDRLQLWWLTWLTSIGDRAGVDNFDQNDSSIESVLKLVADIRRDRSPPDNLVPDRRKADIQRTLSMLAAMLTGNVSEPQYGPIATTANATPPVRLPNSKTDQ